MKTLQVTKSFWLWAALGVGLFVLSSVSRFYGLEFKPLHFDESINGWFVMKMHKDGFFQYDPNNFHGPLYFYLLQLCEFFWGSSLKVLRTLPSFFSIATVMIFAFPLTKSRVWLWLSAGFVLLSPAMIFFGRSGIHEMPFVFFQIVFALGMIRWLSAQKDAKALALLLFGLFGMVTLKETFAIFIFSGLVGVLILGPEKIRENFSPKLLKSVWNSRLSVLALVLSLLFVALFTGFARNWGGLIDFVRAFLPWLKTGVHGAGHDKEFSYWLTVLWQFEPLALLGLVASVLSLRSGNEGQRWLAALGLVQFLVYSLIPYKTIWCILSLVWPFYLVLAFYIARVIEQRRVWFGGLIGLLVLVAVGVGARSIWRASYQNPIDLDHPYVYVNSTYEFQELNDALNLALKEQPELRKALMQVGGKEQWPWPWALRRSEGMNFTLCRNRILAEAFVYICDSDEAQNVEEQLKEPYLKWVFPLRQSQLNSVVYLKASIFSRYLPGKEIVGPDSQKQQE